MTVAKRATPGKYLVFALAGQEYGLSVLAIREIMKMMKITAIPGLPPYKLGTINLRGKIIPIVDLRLKFGQERQEQTDETAILVVEIAAKPSRAMSDNALFGLVVDSVSDVLNILDEEMEDPPASSDHAPIDCVSGTARVRDKIKILLDPNHSLVA